MTISRCESGFTAVDPVRPVQRPAPVERSYAQVAEGGRRPGRQVQHQAPAKDFYAQAADFHSRPERSARKLQRQAPAEVFYAQPADVNQATALPVQSQAPAPVQSSYAQAADVRQTSTRSAEITIVTAEGDKVTLSLAAQSQQTVSTYQAQGLSESGQTQSIVGQDTQSRQSTQVGVSIEGDLNQTEMSDIKKLIQAFGQFTQGDSSGIAQFGSMQSLATAKMAYSGSNDVNYAAARVYA